MKRSGNFPVLTEVEIVDAGSEGQAVARFDDLVVFVPFAVPGDVADLQVTRKRRHYWEARVIRFHRHSTCRAEPFCRHFGICGGCRWQNMTYEAQLFFKQKQVEENLRRIGKIPEVNLRPILPADSVRFYRNKLEFTFSNRKWLTEADAGPQNALGFHIPGKFDKVLDIQTCYLQQDPSNAIRLALRAYARENRLSFYDVRTWTGFLRNVVIRITSTGDIMVILVVKDDLQEEISGILNHIHTLFPEISSLYYVVNRKRNDSLLDQKFVLFRGKPAVTEVMPAFRTGDRPLVFTIGPASFYQTNSRQAEKLYRTATDLAGFRGDEVVYDLYTGTGTVANYIARQVKEVMGIESVEAAVRDAIHNSQVNDIRNTRFYGGETERILTREFVERHGQPDVIITDPPRAGMHHRVVETILEINPEKILYISCNPATQARDISWLQNQYRVVACQPLDMFPHTHHVENVALLKRI